MHATNPKPNSNRYPNGIVVLYIFTHTFLCTLHVYLHIYILCRCVNHVLCGMHIFTHISKICSHVVSCFPYHDGVFSLAILFSFCICHACLIRSSCCWWTCVHMQRFNLSTCLLSLSLSLSLSLFAPGRLKWCQVWDALLLAKLCLCAYVCVCWCARVGSVRGLIQTAWT